MESDISKEGFEYIYKKGARIIKYIADADSSSYPLLKYNFPWKIIKVDCENHMMRNFTSNLE